MLFLVLGLAIAISTVVALMTLSKAMNADIANKLDEFGANILIVPKSDDLSLTYGGMTVSGVSLETRQLDIKDAEAIRTIENSENIKIVAPKLLSVATLLQTNVLVVGVRFEEELQLKKWWKLSGKKPVNDREAILGADARRKLQLEIGQPVEIQGNRFVVSGILEETGSQDDEIVFIDLQSAQRLFGKPQEVSLIEVAALCYDCPIEEIVRQTSAKLPGAKVVAIRQTIESKMEAMHRFEHFSYGISAVVLLVASLIVVTNMTASVNERTREIGVFRAIGFRQVHVMKIILTEALLISVLAGLLGYLAGLGISRIAAPFLMNGDDGVMVNYLLLGVSLALAVVIGISSSIYPAYRASRLDPSIALRAL
ncbi:MAG: FtsX-like permease family protein [Bacteroidota bacterium]